MTPRGTDWSLALLAAIGFATGIGGWFAGSPSGAWVLGAHAAGGTALALVLAWKLRRVGTRVARPGRWTRRHLAGASHVRVVSHTGYRWSFDLADAPPLLLATRVGASR